MTPERYRRIGEIFDAWLEGPEAGREELLRAACAEDAPLRAEVERLLASHRQAPDFLVPAAQPAVESIGPYRILRQIGEGGMGIVYLARQSEPIRREVALKVIRPGMGTQAINARFSAERRALALIIGVKIRIA